MAKATALKDALKALEAKDEMPKEEMEHVKLYGIIPPIAKLDASLSTLKKCKKLSLSTNTIDKITSVSGMDSLEVLSLGRNNIKKIEGLDGVADTLKELWISYNNIEKLAGIEKLKALEVLFMCVRLRAESRRGARCASLGTGGCWAEAAGSSGRRSCVGGPPRGNARAPSDAVELCDSLGGTRDAALLQVKQQCERLEGI